MTARKKARKEQERRKKVKRKSTQAKKITLESPSYTLLRSG